jgi:hypothetical protein
MFISTSKDHSRVVPWGEMEALLEVGGVKTTVSVTVRVLTAELKDTR